MTTVHRVALSRNSNGNGNENENGNGNGNGSGLSRHGSSHAATLSDAVPVAALTKRQREVVALVAQGCTNQQIADELVGVKRSLGVRPQIGVPLDVDGERRGALIAPSAAADFFSQRDLRFLRAVARWVGGVVHRTELTQQVTAAAFERLDRTVTEHGPSPS